MKLLLALALRNLFRHARRTLLTAAALILGIGISLMLEINRRDGTTFIFSTHDPKVMVHAHRVLRLADGRIQAKEAE